MLCGTVLRYISGEKGDTWHKLLSNQLRVAHAELGRFITRCDHAMQTTEQRILHTYTR